MKYYLVKLYILIIISSNSWAFGEAQNKADYYFDRRENYTNISKAQKIYKYIINNSENPAEKIHALHRFGRLTILRAKLAPFIWGQPVKNAAGHFERCIKLSTQLSPQALGYEVPEYVYWRAVCIGLWADNSHMFSITFNYDRIIEMINLIKHGEKVYKNFNNGAFTVLRAGLDVKSRFLKIFDLYNPEHALSLIELNYREGYDDYTLCLLKAEALLALGQKNAARETLKLGIFELEKRQEHAVSKRIEDQAVIYMMKESIKNLEFTSYTPIKI